MPDDLSRVPSRQSHSNSVKTALFLFLVMIALAAHGGDLVLDVSEDAVTACGATPGAEILFLDVSWPERPWLPGVSTSYSAVTDDDGDGCATRVFEEDVPRATVAVAVDQSSGRFGSGASQPIVVVEEELPAAWHRNPAGRVHGFDLEARRLEILVDRPGAGRASWRATIGDGGASDADGAENGSIRFRCNGMRPLRGSAVVPETLDQGDLLIALDASARKVYFYSFGPPQGPPDGSGE